MSLPSSSKKAEEPDLCDSCSKVISLNHTGAVLCVVATECIKHPELHLHLDCFQRQATIPRCRCKTAKQPRRYPINHGDSPQSPPVWRTKQGGEEEEEEHPQSKRIEARA